MKILVYPYDANPYQKLLYRSLERDNIIKYFNPHRYSHTFGFILMPIELLLYRVQGYSVFHLHWLFKFSFPNDSWVFRNVITRLFFTLYLIILILYIKLLGFRLIWTIHNLIQHEPVTISDIKITKFISIFANAIIVHSNATLNDLQILNISIKKCYIMPIGNFINEYPNVITHEEALKICNINKNSFVFVYFGIIRRYKGVSKLLRTFVNSELYKFSHLIIAGQCLDEMLKHELINLASASKSNIHLFLKKIPDNEVQLYLNAGNCVVLPYEENTSSSASILAASFGKPIIAPLFGSIKDLPNSIGFFYNPSEKDGLKSAMHNAYVSKKFLTKIGNLAFDYSKQHDWNKSAEIMNLVYHSK